MLKKIARVFGHFLLVSFVLSTLAFAVGVTQHASINFGEAPLAYKVGGEGPYVFFEDNQIAVNYIRGSREQGFYVEREVHHSGASIDAEAYFPLDDSSFEFTIRPLTSSPAYEYKDDEPILALSDLEGNYKTFRDFLITNQVITPSLEWKFGKGHLVLVGDMVDRGYSTTQLLWFIYKLEQEAAAAGGKVHYIIGNHEIKNLQGNVKSAADKYIPIAGFLAKSSADLLGESSFLGQWLATKNVAEKINGHLFVHGGFHPDIAENNIGLGTVNEVTRRYYRQMYYPGLGDDEVSLLISTKKGPAWYRGYFKGAVSDQQFSHTLAHFNAKSITVGHTIQFSVNSDYQNQLFAIDVKHPNDYRSSFPFKRSEGLYIDGDNHYRVLDDGERIKF